VISQNSRKLYQERAQFHSEYYSELEYLRSQIYDELKSSLLERAQPFEFLNWQRAVKYKYSLVPLSAKGSLADPGGRFNVGAIDASRFPMFAALYLASDKKTALAELLGREDGPVNSLTPEELALTKAASITVVSLSGKLESVLDITDAKNLTPFINLIKGFKISSKLIFKGRKVGLSVGLIRDSTTLMKVLQSTAWREWPMGYDVPAPSQIFGRIVQDAAIEGILYRSVLTDSTWLAVFPQNFQNSSACIEIDDPCPAETLHRRIDSTTFKNFV